MKFTQRFRWPLCGLGLLVLFGVLLFWGMPSRENIGVAEESSQRAERLSTGEENGQAGAKKKNRVNQLAQETSPYLLLHAHNPVDWYPWGPEAFENARKEDKPIFLSIGYSSCYWCHVMERLVFSDEKIARYMNEHFINVKVDREERPDVDDIYMKSLLIFLQEIGSRQGGGWPLSMFLTPRGKPFGGGTYFPPEDQHGRIGFPTLLRRVSERWTNKREAVLNNADRLTRKVQLVMKPRLALTPIELERELAAIASKSLQASYDSKYGGIDFSDANPNAPKFPVPAKLAVLQFEIRKHGNQEAAKIIGHTLDRIAVGGIRDHLGGGFHRYSTDRAWHVPHFEKMLYDQAQLADVYVEAFRRTNKPLYREVAEGIFTYILREMTDPQGGFYSALDAETDGIEGAYYVWSTGEVEKILGDDDAKLFQQVYGMNEPKVFEHGYVLHLPQPIEEAAETLKIPLAQLKRRLGAMRQKLLEARGNRKPLLRDDKLLTSWNGLMIRAFAHAGAVLDREDYLKAARKAASFILSQMRDEKGRLARTYRAKQAKLNAYLDDYAFLIEGLLALHEATGEQEWLETARRLTDDQINLFWDKTGHAFFFTSHHHEALIARTKDAFDAVIPSGNSVSVRNLVRLASLSKQQKYRRYARETLEVFAANLKQSPSGMGTMAVALSEFLDDPDFGAVRTDSPKTSVTPSGKSPKTSSQSPQNPSRSP